MIQYAKVGVLMNFVKGCTIALFIPVLFRITPMAVITDTIRIVPSNSFMANMKLLNTPVIAVGIEPVAVSPKIKIPSMHSTVISFFRTMNINIIIIRSK